MNKMVTQWKAFSKIQKLKMGEGGQNEGQAIPLPSNQKCLQPMMALAGLYTGQLRPSLALGYFARQVVRHHFQVHMKYPHISTRMYNKY